MKEAFPQRLRAVLEERRAAGLYRQCLTLESAQGPVVRLAGRDYLNFCSNDYLGLAAHPKVIASLRDAGSDEAVDISVCAMPDHLVEILGRDRPKVPIDRTATWSRPGTRCAIA